MKQPLLFILLLLAAVPLHASSLEQSLKRLDLTVANSQVYVKKKQAEIERLKGNLNVAVNTTDRYLSCKQLAEAYMKFDSDSALVYWTKCHTLGEKNGNKEWMQEAAINKAYVEADRGDSFIAISKIQLIPFEEVMPELRTIYAKVYLLSYLNYTSGNSMISTKEIQQAWQKYQTYISKDDPEYYVYKLSAVPSANTTAIEQKIRQLCRHYKNDDRKLALCYIVLAQIYKRKGLEDKYIEAAVLATEADIRSANRSSQAIIAVIQYLNEKYVIQQTDRIINYLQLAEEDISTHKDIGRSLEVVNVLNNVTKIYQKQDRQRRTLSFTIIVILFLMVLILAYLYNKVRRQLHSYSDKEIGGKEQISSLSEKVTQKEQEIERLQNRINEQGSRLYAMNSALIKPFALLGMLVKEIHTYKKDMNRMLTANMLHDAKRLAIGSLTKDQATERLYQQFDEAFLALHPDFVERFNRLLRPDAQIMPDDTNSLTPELRIFALVSLGLDDSASIAEVLQYSTQTVYNYRLKVRKGALSHEQRFADAVRALYA